MDSELHFRFEDLQIYQKAIDFGEFVNVLIKKFPRDEQFELTSQFKTASDSVALNIAEGSAGADPQFHNYLDNSWCNTNECVSCGTKAYLRKYISKEEKTKNLESNVMNFLK